MSRVGVFLKGCLQTRQWDMATMAQTLATSQEQLQRVLSGAAFPPAVQRRAWARQLGFADLLNFDDQWRQRKVITAQAACRNLIPVINQAPAGSPRDYEEYGLDSGLGFEYIPRREGQDGPLFAVVIVGDSMFPAYGSGDLVVFRPVNPDEAVPDATPVFVRFGASRDHGCTFKRAYGAEEGWMEFRPDNPRHSSIFARREEIDRLAIAVERRAGYWDADNPVRCIADEHAHRLPEEDAPRRER